MNILRKNHHVCTFLAFIVAALLLNFPLQAQQTAPIIRKMEPPNWWTAFTPEVMVLLTGENFKKASVHASYPGVRITKTQTSDNGHHLFVWLKLGPNTKPGNATLQISDGSSSTNATLPLLARAPRQGRFQGFSENDVIYLIMPDRFADGDPSNNKPAGSTGTTDGSKAMAYHGGDLRGIRQHLPYLHDLGVTAIWLTPIWKNTDSDYHGYHVVDFYATDDHMGTMSEYQALVADAHKLGIKVLLDYVANHTGPKHPWATDPPTPTWLHGTPQRHLEPSYKFNGLVDPHATPNEYRNTLEGWFVDKLPDLNPDDPLLARYLIDNAIWWTEMSGLDGYRLDTFPYSSRHFWSGWHEGIFRLYPNTNSIGEVSDPDSTITSFFEGGRPRFDGVDSRLTTVFDFPMYYALRDVLLRGQPVQKIVDVLQHDSLYERPNLLVTFFGNHDVKRFMGQTGASTTKLKNAFSLLLTMRGVPQLYAGDEIAMPGGDDPDNRRDFPGGFPGEVRNAFTATGRTPDEQDVFEHAQSLLKIRAQHSALRRGRQWHLAWDDTFYAYLREDDADRILVIFNNATRSRMLTIDLTAPKMPAFTNAEPLLGATAASISENKLTITAPPESVSIFALR